MTVVVGKNKIGSITTNPPEVFSALYRKTQGESKGQIFVGFFWGWG